MECSSSDDRSSVRGSRMGVDERSGMVVGMSTASVSTFSPFVAAAVTRVLVGTVTNGTTKAFRSFVSDPIRAKRDNGGSGKSRVPRAALDGPSVGALLESLLVRGENLERFTGVPGGSGKCKCRGDCRWDGGVAGIVVSVSVFSLFTNNSMIDGVASRISLSFSFNFTFYIYIYYIYIIV
jgi:hypothetical protein